MAKEDIISIAREAGLGAALTHNNGEPRIFIEGADWHDELVRFAELLEAKVRADERNALFATAPDLLEALEELLSMCQRQEDFHDDGDGCMFERASAAIAKARGEK